MQNLTGKRAMVVVLNDGETFSDIEGCRIVELSNQEINDPTATRSSKRSMLKEFLSPVWFRKVPQLFPNLDLSVRSDYVSCP
jgi:hypothetical protein